MIRNKREGYDVVGTDGIAVDSQTLLSSSSEKLRKFTMYILKIIRSIKGYGQKQVAEQLGIDRCYLSQVEGGRRPSKKLLRKIWRLYNIKPSLPY